MAMRVLGISQNLRQLSKGVNVLKVLKKMSKIIIIWIRLRTVLQTFFSCINYVMKREILNSKNKWFKIIQ